MVEICRDHVQPLSRIRFHSIIMLLLLSAFVEIFLCLPNFPSFVKFFPALSEKETHRENDKESRENKISVYKKYFIGKIIQSPSVNVLSMIAWGEKSHINENKIKEKRSKDSYLIVNSHAVSAVSFFFARKVLKYKPQFSLSFLFLWKIFLFFVVVKFVYECLCIELNFSLMVTS